MPVSPKTCRLCRIRRIRRPPPRGSGGRTRGTPEPPVRQCFSGLRPPCGGDLWLPLLENTVTVTTHTRFTATVLGLPRIGPRRELKRAVEGYWAGRIDAAELQAVARQLRAQGWTAARDAGIDAVPVGTFSFYDQMLDTAVMLGALPPRVAGIGDPLDRYFAAARGADGVEPLEMTKWFDTNYHYLVPEIGPDTRFALDPSALLGEL